MDVFTNWNLIRASGFLAYFLLTLSIMAGGMQKLSDFQNHKPLLMELHKISGWTGVLTVVFHGTLLLVDKYVPYNIVELLIPFAAENEPFHSGIGTLSFYLFLIVMATSDFFMKKLGFQLWKKLHFLVFPAWVFMTLHGIFIGTDSGQVWAIFIYCASIVLITALLVMRILEGKVKAVNSHKAS
ncbi:ferric reductase-like transmembrane domain-containing protein [Ureibacillus sp. FSL K6-8385]|uniref:Iron reductase n=1 Tax=Ureibacillus terrenus TaxID=118246 RepID=A0A540V541_9BACL|nr:ferric reductase-like transmembrane domain-containing protein [Ureibacillus terrenus]MED3662859.1 ferric reductase-like transmembrane domain-containing protein [Ureibacillus terrenus]MED3763843.1 ferric reductase-like transmembrane domain-containing protein [Ureibacillus terrenus]TQE91263.1 iron reductase [Ureibacillus terrenus]